MEIRNKCLKAKICQTVKVEKKSGIAYKDFDLITVTRFNVCQHHNFLSSPTRDELTWKRLLFLYTSLPHRLMLSENFTLTFLRTLFFPSEAGKVSCSVTKIINSLTLECFRNPFFGVEKLIKLSKPTLKQKKKLLKDVISSCFYFLSLRTHQP